MTHHLRFSAVSLSPTSLARGLQASIAEAITATFLAADERICEADRKTSELPGQTRRSPSFPGPGSTAVRVERLDSAEISRRGPRRLANFRLWRFWSPLRTPVAPS